MPDQPTTLCTFDTCADAATVRGFCKSHYYAMRRRGAIDVLPARSTEDRFWSKVNKDGPIPAHRPDLGPCWIWTAYRDVHGYGHFKPAGGRLVQSVLAYRWAQEAANGPIPEGHEGDHLCRNPPCVRPSHIEPVPKRVNILRGIGPTALNARKTECHRGHALVASQDGRTRYCRACKTATDRQRIHGSTARQRKAAGLCVRCSGVARPGMTMCGPCARAWNAYQAARKLTP